MSVALAAVLEKDWQAQVVEVARTLGWRVFHPYDSRRSAHGWPDLSLCRDRLILLELKRERTKLSEPQKDWLRALLDAGAEAYVARPSDLDALALILACPGPPWKVARARALEAYTQLHEATRRECT